MIHSNKFTNHGQDAPIVVLITICTLRRDHLGCYGYRRNTSPFIDRLASEGRRYDNAFTPVPVTQPAHTAIFTARYSGWNGVGVYNATWVPPSPNWIKRLNDAGVNTAGFVSSIVLSQNTTGRFDLTHYDDHIVQTAISRDNITRRAETTIDACLEWFKHAPQDQPIFSFLHITDVHAPYDVPNPIASQFVQPHYKGTPLPLGDLYAPGGIAQEFSLAHLSDFPGEHFGDYYVDRYDGCVLYVDHHIERLVEELKERFGTRLLVILASDHGEALGEDNYWCIHSHGVLPNQTRIPFIVWSGESKHLARMIDSTATISLLDIGPTILDWFGNMPKPNMPCHGRSLLDLASDRQSRRVFAASPTQLLAYNHEYNNGAVVGEQTQIASFHHTINIEQQRNYFDTSAPPNQEQVAEALLFYTLATTMSLKYKPISATWFEHTGELQVLQRLADLGYVDHIPENLSAGTIENYFMPFSTLRGIKEWQLPRVHAEKLARDLQIRPALDLGCGTIKNPGFIGLDRFPLPGVDCVSNLDVPLPFADNSFDLILASHSLEHVQDLNATMREVYRVARHGAQVCIVAPYFAQGINLANPHHKQGFNEHTPRFWTTNHQTQIDSQEYFHPQAGLWGLGESDNSELGIDLRCIRMEFFYFSEYRNLPFDKQRTARKKYLDVCDQMVYHLIVVKEPIDEANMQELTDRIEYYDPPYVKIRRLEEILEQEKAQSQTILAARNSELTRIQELITARDSELVQTQTSLAEHGVELSQLQSALAASKSELAESQIKLAAYQDELVHAQSDLTQHQEDLAQTRAKLAERDNELDKIRLELVRRNDQLRQQESAFFALEKNLHQERQINERSESKMAQLATKGQALAQELGASRQRRLTRMIDQVVNRSNVWNEIGTPFQQLKDDCLLFHSEHELDGYLLQPSDNLVDVPFIYYRLPVHRANLSAILLAPILDFPTTDGTLGIEIVSPENAIVAQSLIPLSEVSDVAPTRLPFTPLEQSNQGQFWLRVFVRDARVPVRIFEWRKYSWLGIGHTRTHAFCGFEFQQ